MLATAVSSAGRSGEAVLLCCGSAFTFPRAYPRASPRIPSTGPCSGTEQRPSGSGCSAVAAALVAAGPLALPLLLVLGGVGGGRRRQRRARHRRAGRGVRLFASPASGLLGGRLGSIDPSDPVLEDPRQQGRGLYSQADFLRFLRNAKPYGWAECEVEGEVPPDLLGTLYHNGPGRVERGGLVYNHFLDGDGFISAWRFENGSVSYRGDFVRTPEYEAEETAGSVLFRGAFGTAKPGGPLANAFDLKSKNLSNTNVVAWGGRLFSLYEAARPCRIDPDSLAYSGTEDFDGLLQPGLSASSGQRLVDQALGLGGDAFTAHPKLDPEQALLVGFSWTSKNGGIELQAHEFNEDLSRRASSEHYSKVFVPDCDSSPHDFGLTRERLVFLENRFRLDNLAGYLLGMSGPAESLVSRPELPQRIHIISRNGIHEPITINGSCAVFDIHVAHCHDGPPLAWTSNAHDGRDGDLFTVYTSSWDEFPEGSLFGEWNEEGEPWPFELPDDAPRADMSKTPRARLVCHVVDAARGTVLERAAVRGCEDLCMEHPTINCSYTASPACRYIYMVVGNESGLSTPPCGWARVDLLTGETQRWFAGSRAFADEPHFVPRGGGGLRGTWTPGAPPEGAAEDDGWLVAMLFDAASGRSCLCVLDAARIEEGPVCRAWLPHGVPHSLHGCWVPGKGTERGS